MQCKQCVIRFAESTSGKKDMQDHLDMHFRQNRKANQNIECRYYKGIETCHNKIKIKYRAFNTGRLRFQWNLSTFTSHTQILRIRNIYRSIVSNVHIRMRGTNTYPDAAIIVNFRVPAIAILRAWLYAGCCNSGRLSI